MGTKCWSWGKAAWKLGEKSLFPVPVGELPCASNASIWIRETESWCCQPKPRLRALPGPGSGETQDFHLCRRRDVFAWHEEVGMCEEEQLQEQPLRV